MSTIDEAARLLEIGRQEDEWAKRNGTAPTPAPPPFVAGHFPNMLASDYHATEALSSSGVKKLLRSPQHYKLMRTKPNEPTEAMQFGTAVHCAILEPDLYSSLVAVTPEINRRTALGKALWAECQELNKGKIILTREDEARVRACAFAVRAHPVASQLLDSAQVEQSFFWQDGHWKIPCKARLDIVSQGGVTDLKTATDASPEEFAKAIANFCYDIQGAMYFSGAEHVLNRTPEFFGFIVVEPEEPFAVACYRLGAASILAGARRVDIAMERYAAALATGYWPGYSPTLDVIETPAWARRFSA